MSKLKIPSEIHAARLWRNSAALICKEFIKLHDNTPFFNYIPLESAILDLLTLGVPYEQVKEGMNRIKREKVRQNFLEVLPLIRDYYDSLQPDFIQNVSVRSYPLGKGLILPVKAKFICGVGGKLHFTWPIFWKSNPLTLESENFSLFVSLVQDMMSDDPDLEDAKFTILDFSVPKGGAKRVLRVIDANDISVLSEPRKKEMLEQLVDGFYLAQDQLSKRNQKDQSQDNTERYDDPNQQDLFR